MGRTATFCASTGACCSSSHDDHTRTSGRAECSGSALGVCFLITDFDAPTGGVQSHTRRLIEGLSKQGVKLSVCARNYHRRPRNEVNNGVIIHRTPVPRTSLRASNSALYLADGFAWLLRNRDRFDVLHCQQMFGPAMLGLFAKQLLGKPVVVRVTSTGDLGEVRHIRRMPFARFRLRQLRAVDCWVALTSAMRDEILTLGVLPERVRIIPNSTAIPTDAGFAPGIHERYRTALGIDYPKMAVFAGRLSEEKGLDVLLRAWARLCPTHSEAHLVILGSGGRFRNVEEDLRQLCQSLQLEERVHFLGHVSNVMDYLLAADLFVLPTRAEGMSNSLVEAMAAGVPIVTTDIPANLDLVEHERNALLTEPGDDQGLAAAILRILKDDALALRLAQAARQEAERNLSLETMVDRYLNIYRLLAEGARCH